MRWRTGRESRCGDGPMRKAEAVASIVSHRPTAVQDKITVDNGREFAGKVLDARVYDAGVKLAPVRLTQAHAAKGSLTTDASCPSD